MKKKAAITALILTIVILAAQFAYAQSPDIIVAPASGALSITGTVPEDSQTGRQISNFAVKIKFNQDMSLEDNDSYNEKNIIIKDDYGKVQKFQIQHHPKYTNEIWCILEGDLDANTQYTVTIQNVKSSSGNTLPEEYSFSFTTRNTKVDNTISIFMTIGMMVIMIMATSSANKKQEETAAQKGKKNMSVEKIAQADPYRYAKEKGISVEEAKAEIAKEKAKLDKKNSSAVKAKAKYEKNKAAREAEIERRIQEIHDASVYKVHKAGSMVEHGCKIPKGVVKKLAKYSKKKK